MRPRYSVVLPVHNDAAVVGRSLASVLAQTFADLEVIVVDAGCADATVEVVRSLSDRRVRIIGPTDRVVTDGFGACRGRFVTLLGAADHVDPGWLSRLGRVADSTGAGVVSCGGVHRHPDHSTTRVLPTPLADIGSSVTLRPGAIVVRRDLTEPGSHSTFIGLVSDALASAAERGVTVVSTPEPLVHWEEAEQSDAPEGDDLTLRSSMQVIDALAQSPIPEPQRLAHFATRAGIAAVKTGDVGRGRRLLRVARSAQPGEARAWARWLVACVPPLATRVWPTDEEHGHDDTRAGMVAAAR